MSRHNLFAEISAERQRQDEKWGDVQERAKFLRSFHPSNVDRDGRVNCSNYRIPSERLAKLLCNEAYDRGKGDCMRILVEEVCEVAGAGNNNEKLKSELIQVAAVCVFWIELLQFQEAGK